MQFSQSYAICSSSKSVRGSYKSSTISRTRERAQLSTTFGFTMAWVHKKATHWQKELYRKSQKRHGKGFRCGPPEWPTSAATTSGPTTQQSTFWNKNPTMHPWELQALPSSNHRVQHGGFEGWYRWTFNGWCATAPDFGESSCRCMPSDHPKCMPSDRKMNEVNPKVQAVAAAGNLLL
jgi:hypothetical protein